MHHGEKNDVFERSEEFSSGHLFCTVEEIETVVNPWCGGRRRHAQS
jgi:hypothetical protein